MKSLGFGSNENRKFAFEIIWLLQSQRAKKKNGLYNEQAHLSSSTKRIIFFFFCSLPAKGTVHKRSCLKIGSFLSHISCCLFWKLCCTMRNHIFRRQPNNIFFLMPVKGWSSINDVVSEMAIYIPCHPHVAFLVFEVCVLWSSFGIDIPLYPLERTLYMNSP